MSNFDDFGKTADSSGSPHPLLLVSVATPDEAALARSSGVDWIDLKNPAAGSLGAPTPDIAAQTLHQLSNFPHRSIALGELLELDERAAAALVGTDKVRYPIAKVGLAHVERAPADRKTWTSRLTELQKLIAPTQLVPVLYADGSRCDAPSAAAVLQFADEQRPPFVLVDTFFKDGRGLFDWLSVDELREFRRAVAATGSRLVLAGSLRWKDLAALTAVAPDVIAVRGAVCTQPTDRSSRLCSEKLRQWTQALAIVPNRV